MVGLSAFGGAFGGLLVSHFIPRSSLSAATPLITSVNGLVAGRLALVLGLLVWTSHGVFVNQQSEVYALGTSINRLLFLLNRLGPQAQNGLVNLRAETLAIRRRFWGDRGVQVLYSYKMSRQDMAQLELSVAALKPTTDEEKRIVAVSLDLCSKIIDSQLTMTRQLRNPTPALLFHSVAAWSTLPFFGCGCLATFSVPSLVAAAAGSGAVALAIFVIAELEQPYLGLYTVTARGIDLLIEAFDNPEGELSWQGRVPSNEG